MFPNTTSGESRYRHCRLGAGALSRRTGGGITHGSTDELGYNAVEDVVEVHDMHATMLHLLGVDHETLSFESQGRNFRLTDVHGNVVKKILA